MKIQRKFQALDELLVGKIDLMSINEIGAFVLLAGYLWTEADGTTPRSVFQRMISNRGVGADAAGEIVASLAHMGAIVINEHALLTIPAISAIKVREMAKFTNRQLGWGRRRDESPSAPAIAKARIATRAPQKTDIQRLDDGADDNSQIIATAHCKGDRTVEITRAWATSKKKIFPGLADIEREVMLAAEWTLNNPSKRKTTKGTAKFLVSWMSNAERASSMQTAVIAGARRRNGFGLGGHQDEPASKAESERGVSMDGLADLDMFAGKTASVIASPEPNPSLFATPDPVAARSSKPVTPAPAATKPAMALRRPVIR